MSICRGYVDVHSRYYDRYILIVLDEIINLVLRPSIKGCLKFIKSLMYLDLFYYLDTFKFI
jgi:hypothetical protein